jgi:hypothetical protein
MRRLYHLGRAGEWDVGHDRNGAHGCYNDKVGGATFPHILGESIRKEDLLAKVNYNYEKRQREIAKKKKKEEKQKEKLNKKTVKPQEKPVQPEEK